MIGKLAMIDLSSNNGSVDLRKLWAAGYRILMLKVSEGTGYTWSESLKYSRLWHSFGGIVLHYHWLTPGSAASGTAQADYYWSHVRQDLGIGDKFVVDVETQGDTGSETHAFIERMHQHAPHIGGLVYSTAYFLRDNHITPVHGWGLHVAGYPNVDFIPPGWNHWTAHQYTQTGSAPGVNGHVDISYIRRELLQPTLHKGDECWSVLEMATALRKLGYKGFVLNQTYGLGKARAVARFKRQHRWKNPDGRVVGRPFWVRLNKEAG